MSLQQEIKHGIACDSVGKPESIIGRAVCLSVHPGKMLLFPFMHWFEKRYKGKYHFAKMLFSFDLLLMGALLGIGSALLFLIFSGSAVFEKKILFEASIAPIEIVTGASSTLVIRYTNTSEEELRNASLTLQFPDHFLVQEIAQGDRVLTGDTLELGNIAAMSSGAVHIRGVMFGDVGGEQTFTSTLRFFHGTKKNKLGTKVDHYTFSPASSTLELALALPERLVAFQTVQGTITYRNTGEIDFPSMSIEPRWPEGFVLSSSSIAFKNGVFDVPELRSGKEGIILFTGLLTQDIQEAIFLFQPSFRFDEDRYQQEALVHTAPVVPAQLTVEHSTKKSSLEPGAQAEFTITFENTSDETLTDLVVSLQSESPFFPKNSYSVNASTQPALASLAPHAKGQIEIRVPLRSSILQSETNSFENPEVISTPIIAYTLGDGSSQSVTIKGNPLRSPLTTPVFLESFGRYTSPTGDQLGRGPLPPKIGKPTTYWIFWHVNGTMNDLTDVRIEGALGNQVTFTGRQSSSQNSGVTYNEQRNTIQWETDLIKPTFSSTSKTVGVAFEVSVTPDETMIGTSPILLSDIILTARDARTGAFVSASGKTISTDLPGDLMADDKNIVVD